MLRVKLSAAALLMVSVAPREAAAQSTTRDKGWDDATTALAVAGGITNLLMPRVFYSNPEATVGWKARWHVSALAPVMTQAALAFFNEIELKRAFADPRPGCDGAVLAGCESFGLFSTQALGSASTLGHGVSVFLFDTLNHTRSQFHFGSLAGHVLLPLALTSVTVAGRLAGNLESEGQVFGSAGVGLLSGFAFGALYALMQDPACGYTGDLICW